MLQPDARQGAVARPSRLAAYHGLGYGAFDACPLGIRGGERRGRLLRPRPEQGLVLLTWAERQLPGHRRRARALSTHRAGPACGFPELDLNEGVRPARRFGPGVAGLALRA